MPDGFMTYAIIGGVWATFATGLVTMRTSGRVDPIKALFFFLFHLVLWPLGVLATLLDWFTG